MCVSLAALSAMNGISSLAGGIARNEQAKSLASIEQLAGNMRARAIRRAAVQETGSARAAAAASGVSVSSGSVMEAERDIARYSEQDAMVAVLTGDNRAATMRGNGRAALSGGVDQAAGSLLEAADTWRRTRRRVPYRADDPYRNPGYVGGSEGE